MESCLLAALAVPVGHPQTIRYGRSSHGWWWAPFLGRPILCSPPAPLVTPPWGLCGNVIAFLRRLSVLAFCQGAGVWLGLVWVTLVEGAQEFIRIDPLSLGPSVVQVRVAFPPEEVLEPPVLLLPAVQDFVDLPLHLVINLDGLQLRVLFTGTSPEGFQQ